MKKKIDNLAREIIISPEKKRILPFLILIPICFLLSLGVLFYTYDTAFDLAECESLDKKNEEYKSKDCKQTIINNLQFESMFISFLYSLSYGTLALFSISMFVSKLERTGYKNHILTALIIASLISILNIILYFLEIINTFLSYAGSFIIYFLVFRFYYKEDIKRAIFMILIYYTTLYAMGVVLGLIAGIVLASYFIAKF